MPLNFLITGHGDNTLLICAVTDECDWHQEFPMAEDLSSFIEAQSTHWRTAHRVEPSTRTAPE
jgi:hypothetical protein